MALYTLRATPGGSHVCLCSRFFEAHNFIFVQASSLKIGTLDISALLFLTLLSELNYEVWIKSYRHLQTRFFQEEYVFVTF